MDDSAEPLWLAMEIGTLVSEHLGPTPSLTAVVKALRSYAETLAQLTDENVYHRDIKPSNLYWLNGGFVIGDFGIADFPDKAGLTRSGDKVGPANYLAPEMIEYSGEVSSGPADVYSAAKTLWAIAAGHKFPPPGELRRDRRELRLTTYVQHAGAAMLEPLLERATSHDPSKRPTMRELANELSWWGEPEVTIPPDLSGFAEEIKRIREATVVVQEETEQQRLERLYSEAASRVYTELTMPLMAALENAGLGFARGGDRPLEGWFGSDYGGTWNSSYWGVGTFANSWLAIAIGIVHRAHPEPNLRDLKLVALVAQMDPESQHNFIAMNSESFQPESLAFNRTIKTVKSEIESQLPTILAHFLAECKKAATRRIN